MPSVVDAVDPWTFADRGGGAALTRTVASAVRSALRSHALWLSVAYLGLLLLMARAYA